MTRYSPQPSSCTPPQSAPRCSGWPPDWPSGTHASGPRQKG
jgi:hypothetical protein